MSTRSIYIVLISHRITKGHKGPRLPATAEASRQAVTEADDDSREA